ncbi:hypothetical protein HD554DRAFT_2042204 [Boletus coccyginus]|nr:hypothetical protein HD554DRAFT_2042204 [Boletus coccyginus]
MFNNSSHIDANHSTFSEVHRDQYFTSRTNVQGNQTINTIIHGNQILQSSQIGLEALHKASAPSAVFDSAERHPAPRCLEGTRVQLLDRLTLWIHGESENDNDKPICWVNGRPGSGKSAISQTIAEKFTLQKRLAASFFFSRRDIERRTTRHFFPTIATQFLFSIPAIRPAILAALEQDSMIPSKVLREQMQKLLLEPLSSGLEQPGSSFLIVVDALDECDDPRLVVELVSLLIQLVRNSPLPLGLLITSRPEPWLQAHFRQQDVASITLTLEIESFNVEDDIRRFLQHALNQVYQEHSQVMPNAPWPSPKDLNLIVEKASGLFIFALTVVKFVGDRLHNPAQRLQVILDDKPSRDTTYAELDTLYLDAVSTFPDPDIVRLILGIVYCLSVPMTVPALHRLLDRPDLSSENGEQPIQFYHASFRDFLVSPQRSRRSLKRNMCGLDDPSKLIRDIEDLPERRRVAHDEALLYACRYWSHHLTQLPSQGGVYESLLDTMQEFCSRTLLYWIETASIFGDVEKAIIMLRGALNWLKLLAPVPKQTATLIEEAERLMLLYRQPISQSAPHVYHTAITFIPSSSALYANFKHDAGGSCTIHQGQDDEWQAYQYGIDLGSVTSVAFSPNGSVVATAGDQGVRLWNVVTGGNVASLGDNGSSSLVSFSASGAFVAAAFTDGMVAVWDPNLGREHLKDVGAHTDKITCLEFSPDSVLLASGALDHTIQLWSLESAQRLHKLVAHEGPVTVLTFMPDSQRLCSGSEDNLLILWDVHAGKVARGMMGHRAGITALNVSRDGTMVVTGSRDKTIKVWDVLSGSCTRTLSKGHKNLVRSVHFFDDDKRFLSASAGTVLASSVSFRRSFSDVSIWDWGQHIQSLMGNAPIWQAKVIGRGVPAFLLRKAFEPNWNGLTEEELLVAYSSQLPSFSFSYLSETWCVPFGSEVDRPSIHGSRAHLSALALSPDGTRVAAVNSVGSLDILDTTVPSRTWVEEVGRDLAVPLRSATTVVASPNGARFLVNSAVPWYLTNGQFQPLSKVDFGIADYARTDDVPKPIFSADSSTFAWSMSDIWERQNKNTVRVYESTTETQKVRFSGIKKVQVFCISPGGNFIGCGHEGAVTVCDVGKRTKKEMDVAGDSFTALDFSGDSMTLLSGSEQGVVQLWDPSSGACKATITHEEFHSPATAVSFAPQGNIVVIAHEDGTVRLVSLLTSASHTVCPCGIAFTQTVQFVQFSQDPPRLICKTGDNDVSFWTVPAQLFPPGEGEANHASCPVCDQQETSNTSQSGDALSDQPTKGEIQDAPPSLPHLISKYEDQAFDGLFRSPTLLARYTSLAYIGRRASLETLDRGHRDALLLPAGRGWKEVRMDDD